MRKYRKLLWFVSIIGVLILGGSIVAWWGLANAKTYINNNGESLVGRIVFVDDLDVNLFNAKVKLNDLVVFEPNKIDTFLSLRKMAINFNLRSFLGKTYVVDGLAIEGLKVKLIQQGGTFNFKDILDQFSKRDSVAIEIDTEETNAIDFIIKNIDLASCEIHYVDENLPHGIDLTGIDFSLPTGISSSVKEVAGRLSFTINNAGFVAANFEYGIQTDVFKTALNIENLEFRHAEPYLKDYIYFDSIGGVFNAELLLSGLLKDPAKADASGHLNFKDVSITDTLHERLAAFNDLSIYVDSLNAAKNKYAIRKIKLSGLSGIYHIRNEEDNFSTLIKPTQVVADTSETILAIKSLVDKPNNFIAELSANVLNTIKTYEASNLHVDTVLVNEGNFTFYDHTLLQPFKYVLSEITATSNEMYFDNDSVRIELSALLNGSGRLQTGMFIFPQSGADLKLDASIVGLDLIPVSPYSYYYLGHDIDSGKLAFTTHVIVRDSLLKSNNHVIINHMVLGKKTKHDEIVKLPVKTAVAALKDKNGIIEIDIPIEGDLSNPDYKLKKVIGRVLKNLVVKAASSPVKIVGKLRKRK